MIEKFLLLIKKNCFLGDLPAGRKVKVFYLKLEIQEMMIENCFLGDLPAGELRQAAIDQTIGHAADDCCLSG